MSICCYYPNNRRRHNLYTMLTPKNIIIDDAIRAVCPVFVGAAVYAEVTNTPRSAALWEEIGDSLSSIASHNNTETLKQISGISATRQVYRALGKDPSRYRPSNEALIRRVLQGKGLYQISTLVDAVNLASIEYKYSIGGFDFDKIHGDTLTLGVGRHDEPYEGIGRGMLNIENLPVYRDSIGGIGTPTSDNERTKLSLNTTALLAIINGYDGNKPNVRACAERLAHLLETYASATWTDIQEF